MHVYILDPDTKQAIKDAVLKEQQIQNQEIERTTFAEPIDEQHDQGTPYMTSHDKDSMNRTCNIPVAQTQVNVRTVWYEHATLFLGKK